MSFILDALKKSEAERQQQSGAELAGIPTTPGTPPIPRWLWVVGSLLAVNLVVLLGLLLKPDSVVTELPPPTQAQATDPQTATALPSFEEQVATAQRNPPEQQAGHLTIEQPEPIVGIIRPDLISQNPSAVAAEDLYPSILEVRASGLSNLPELHLDIHVYSAEPKDRFVFINMAKLHEGSQLAEGPVVSEITPDGVVLRHQGQLFLLPRD